MVPRGMNNVLVSTRVPWLFPGLVRGFLSAYVDDAPESVARSVPPDRVVDRDGGVHPIDGRNGAWHMGDTGGRRFDE